MTRKRRTEAVTRPRVSGRPSPGAGLGPLLAIGVACVAGVAILAVALISLLSQPASGTPVIPGQAGIVAGIPCDPGEHLTYHVHAQLRIRVDGTQVPVPPSIGIRRDANCIYWLHTHDATGLLHVEAPTQRDFNLGQFFDVWGQPLGPHSVGGHQLDEGEQLFVFVNGQRYERDPRTIPLVDGAIIELQVGTEPLPPITA